MPSLDENLNKPILVNPVCDCGPRTIKSISKLLFSIWKKNQSSRILGIDLSRGGGVSKKPPKDVSREKIDL